VSYDRKTKKDAFYFYKANWSDEPTLYITSRRFTERTNAVTDVKVYSNANKWNYWSTAFRWVKREMRTTVYLSGKMQN
jgi:beta-galactosidase